jgi:hypothetical protein
MDNCAGLELVGLTSEQDKICCAEHRAFLDRHDLKSWRLCVKTADMRVIEYASTAPSGFNPPEKAGALAVYCDLANEVYSVLEAHYRACVNPSNPT